MDEPIRRSRLALITALALITTCLPLGAGSATPVAAGATRGAFVHFEPGTRGMTRLLEERGLRPVTVLRSVDVVFARGPSAAFEALSKDPRVTHVEPNRRLPLLGDTSRLATRVADAQTPASVHRGPAGEPLDGKGVGVAVIDTGILSAHPDLSSVVANYKIACGGCPVVETDVSDTSSGHGTHVAGIVAGTGAQSEGRFRGVAPGAGVFGFGVGETIYVLNAAAAFDYIVTHYDEFEPRIRVVTNSYGAPDTFDPESVVNKAVAELVERGTTVVWAAGNSGGNGSADMMVDTAKNPLPGVISVGNYDDSDTGTRDGSMYSSSSRGLKGSPEIYPDIAAPGTRITSTCIQEIQPVCHFGVGITTAFHPWYATVGGSSMAAPHVAGIAALLYQADPTLTPARVEDLLQDSAYKFAAGGPYEPDPQNPDGTVSFDKGAGLVDVMGALEILHAVQEEPIKPPKKPKKPSSGRGTR